MALPKIPKPQAGEADPAVGPESGSGGQSGLGGQGQGGDAAPGVKALSNSGKVASSAASKIPVIGRPIGAITKLGRKGSQAAKKAKDAASDPAGAVGQSAGNVAGKAARAGAKLAKKTVKAAGKVAKKAAKKAAKQAAKQAAKAGAKVMSALLSNPAGWFVLVVIALLGIFLLGGFLSSLRGFAESFDMGQTDSAVVSDSGGSGSRPSSGSVYVSTQAEHESTTNTMEGSSRATGTPSRQLETNSLTAHRSRASQTWGYPAGEVTIKIDGFADTQEQGGAVMAAVIPDRQRGLADLVEWMLPQWVAPYPVMVAEAEGVEVDTREIPAGSGNEVEVVSCKWPKATWASLPPFTKGPDEVQVEPDDVTIEGVWQPEGQHVCHLIAAADTMWNAWAEVFGEHGFHGSDPSGGADNNGDDAPLLDLDAAHSMWVLNPPDREKNEFAASIGSLKGAADGSDRLWVWLTFAALLGGDDAPVSGQYDCEIAHSDVSFVWGRMGEYAKEGGKLKPVDGSGLPIPEGFYADTDKGDLLVPWPCPRPVRAVLAAGTRGLWEPVVWSPNLSIFGLGYSGWLEDGQLGVSAEALATMGSRGVDVGKAAEHAAFPTKVRETHQALVDSLPDTFNRDWLSVSGRWDAHAWPDSDSHEAWCQPYTVWVSETGETRRVDAERDQPKQDLIDRFEEDREQLGAKLAEANELAGQAAGAVAAISGEMDAVRAAIQEEAAKDAPDQDKILALNAQFGALNVEIGHAREVQTAVGLLVRWWTHALEQADRRESTLPNAAWPFECKHKNLEEALGDLDEFRGDRLPDAASPLRALYTSGGRGRALSVISDHWGGRDSPLENMLRVAQHEGLLPDLPLGPDPADDDMIKPMVSPTCSLERWLDKRCLMPRVRYQGSEVIVFPRTWTDPRVGLKCPLVYAVSNHLMESDLADLTSQWDYDEADFVSHSKGDVSFTSFHPCLLPDMKAAAWLADAVGLRLTAHGFRTWEDSEEWSEYSTLVAPPGVSRHNYGLALDFQWWPPECWPAPERFDEDCADESERTHNDAEYCGTETRNGVRPFDDPIVDLTGNYRDFTTPANIGHPRRAGSNASVDPIVMANWCWRFLDWATYKLSGMADRVPTGDGSRRYPIVGLLPLSIEMWHWSYDGR